MNGNVLAESIDTILGPNNQTPAHCNQTPAHDLEIIKNNMVIVE